MFAIKRMSKGDYWERGGGGFTNQLAKAALYETEERAVKSIGWLVFNGTFESDLDEYRPVSIMLTEGL